MSYLSENVTAQIAKIQAMSAADVADSLEKDLKVKPTGLTLWPEAVEKIIALLRAQSEDSHLPRIDVRLTDEVTNEMIDSACAAVHPNMYRVDAMRAIEAALAAAPFYTGAWRSAIRPLEIRLSVVNGSSTPQWNAVSNKSPRIVISQATPQEALRLALINAGYVSGEEV